MKRVSLLMLSIILSLEIMAQQKNSIGTGIGLSFPTGSFEQAVAPIPGPHYNLSYSRTINDVFALRVDAGYTSYQVDTKEILQRNRIIPDSVTSYSSENPVQVYSFLVGVNYPLYVKPRFQIFATTQFGAGFFKNPYTSGRNTITNDLSGPEVGGYLSFINGIHTGGLVFRSEFGNSSWFIDLEPRITSTFGLLGSFTNSGSEQAISNINLQVSIVRKF